MCWATETMIEPRPRIVSPRQMQHKQLGFVPPNANKTMKSQLFNGQDEIDIQIIAEDGTNLNQDLLPDEVVAFESLDRTLKADPGFQSTYPNAKLIRIDSNRGIQESEAGRYYLRYQYDVSITEFWGHHANTTYVDCDQGLVGTTK